jgi:hypothetical protein
VAVWLFLYLSCLIEADSTVLAQAQDKVPHGAMAYTGSWHSLVYTWPQWKGGGRGRGIEVVCIEHWEGNSGHTATVRQWYTVPRESFFSNMPPAALGKIYLYNHINFNKITSSTGLNSALLLLDYLFKCLNCSGNQLINPYHFAKNPVKLVWWSVRDSRYVVFNSRMFNGNATEFWLWKWCFIKIFYFSWGQYMCGAPERLTAFGARTFQVLSQQ